MEKQRAIHLCGAIFTQIDTARTGSQSFRVTDHRDLWDFAVRVKQITGVPRDLSSAADGLISQLGRTIAYNRHQGSGYANAHGLAIYLPARSGNLDTAYTGGAGAIWNQQAPSWARFLTAGYRN